jgi:hypothetical protein
MADRTGGLSAASKKLLPKEPSWRLEGTSGKTTNTRTRHGGTGRPNFDIRQSIYPEIHKVDSSSSSSSSSDGSYHDPSENSEEEEEGVSSDDEDDEEDDDDFWEKPAATPVFFWKSIPC